VESFKLRYFNSFEIFDHTPDRHVLRQLVGRYGLSCDMAMHPLHWVRRGEGQTARNHFVKRYSKRAEIAACVDRTIHPPGLLRRHVGECSCDELGRSRQLTFARKTRGDIETRELQITCSTDEDIVRLDVLMDQAALVDLFYCHSDGYSYRQKAPNLHRGADHAIQRMKVGSLIVGLR
jgi:hypothetical protein